MKNKEAYCEWNDKPLRAVSEHEMDTCLCDCMECLYLLPDRENEEEE